MKKLWQLWQKEGVKRFFASPLHVFEAVYGSTAPWPIRVGSLELDAALEKCGLRVNGKWADTVRPHHAFEGVWLLALSDNGLFVALLRDDSVEIRPCVDPLAFDEYVEWSEANQA
jgi:hypothetical protein